MLANHVEPEVARFLNVKLEGFVGGGGVQAVGPPALVQRTKLEVGLSVKADAPESLRVTHLGALADGRVSLHGVNGLSIFAELDLQAVQVGVLRAPEFGVFYFDAGRCPHGSGRLGKHAAGAIGQKAVDEFIGLPVDGGLEGEGAVQGSIGLITRDMGRWYRLHPHALPDAGDGGVPDAAGVGYLLAARLQVVVGAVCDADRQMLLAGHEVRGDVHGEAGVAARVHGNGLAVEADLGLPVYGVKVQQRTVFPPGTGNGECAFIPQHTVFSYGFAYAGKG